MLVISSLAHATSPLIFTFNQTPQNPTTMHDERNERILRMLKHSVLAKLPSTSKSPVSAATHLEQVMQNVFPPSFHTPTHPTYASMILRAIDELKEGKGSSEVAISAFIKREYNDLPLGHESFLSHHLSKLCKNGDIQCMGGRYMLQHQNEQHTVICNKQLEDRWKLKQDPHGESKSDTLMIEGELCRRREDSADEKQKQQEQKIDVRSRTIEFCYDDVEGVKVPPVMIEAKLQSHKWQNGSLSLDRQPDQKMDVKPQTLLPSFQDDEENGLSLIIVEKALASSPQVQQENLEQRELNQLYCVDDGSVVPALNQLQQIHNCQRNESNLRRNDLSAYTELHVDAEKEKYSSCKILPKQETELNLNAIASCSSNTKQHLEQQPPKRGRGRPRKTISDVETTSVASSQCRYCKFYNHEDSQLPQNRGRGRPRKLMADAEETTSEKAAMVSTESYYYKFYNDEESPLPQSRGRGLPRKLIADAAETPSDDAAMVSTESYYYKFYIDEYQLPQCRGQGRPPKLISDEGKHRVVPSQSYHYKFYNLEETQLPQTRERGRPRELISDVGKITVVPSQSYHYKFYNREDTQIP